MIKCYAQAGAQPLLLQGEDFAILSNLKFVIHPDLTCSLLWNANSATKRPIYHECTLYAVFVLWSRSVTDCCSFDNKTVVYCYKLAGKLLHV